MNAFCTRSTHSRHSRAVFCGSCAWRQQSLGCVITKAACIRFYVVNRESFSHNGLFKDRRTRYANFRLREQ